MSACHAMSCQLAIPSPASLPYHVLPACHVMFCQLAIHVLPVCHAMSCPASLVSWKLHNSPHKFWTNEPPCAFYRDNHISLMDKQTPMCLLPRQPHFSCITDLKPQCDTNLTLTTNAVRAQLVLTTHYWGQRSNHTQSTWLGQRSFHTQSTWLGQRSKLLKLQKFNI